MYVLQMIFEMSNNVSILCIKCMYLCFCLHQVMYKSASKCMYAIRRLICVQLMYVLQYVALLQICAHDKRVVYEFNTIKSGFSVWGWTGPGANMMFPEDWENYQAVIPEKERGDFIAAFGRRLRGELGEEGGYSENAYYPIIPQFPHKYIHTYVHIVHTYI